MAITQHIEQIQIHLVELPDKNEVLKEVQEFLEAKYGKRSDNYERASLGYITLIIPGKL